MSLFSYNKTENHYHGDAPGLIINSDETNMSDNSINVPAVPDRTGLDILKIILTALLAFIGALSVVYITYIFGLSGTPVKLDCYFPEQVKVEEPKLQKNTHTGQLKKNTEVENKL